MVAFVNLLLKKMMMMMMMRQNPNNITVRHGSADTVVRAMNVFNGKRRFGGSDSSETL